MKKFVTIVLTTVFVLSGMTAGFSAESKIIDVPSVNETIVIDGQNTDKVWNTIPAITDFSLPWNSDEPLPRTSLKLFHNEKYLFFLFEVEDDNLTLVQPFEQEYEVAFEDRVEFFFDTSDSMKLYYSAEMDCQGKVLDYQGSYFRKFEYLWRFPALITKGSQTEKGYVVEGSIELEALRQMNVLKKDKTMKAGFYRAQFHRDSQGKLVERWISWVNPHMPEPEFHTPSSLGTVRLK